MTDVARKLRLGPGGRLRALHAPDGLEVVLGTLPAGATVSASEPAPDVTLLFVRDHAQLARDLAEATRLAAGDRLLWVAYPKRGGAIASDLDRDGLHAAVERLSSLTGVSLISLNDTWSAMRLRPAERYQA